MVDSSIASLDDLVEMFSDDDERVIAAGFSARLSEESPSNNPYPFASDLHGVWIEAYFTAHALIKRGMVTFVDLSE